MKYFWILTLTLFISDAYAQNVCEALLKSANYNQYQTISQNQRYELDKANFCMAEYDKATISQKAQIEASYKLFDIGGSSGTTNISEKQHQECGGTYGEIWFNKLGLQTQKTVSDAAMNAFTKCVDAYKAGLQVEPTFTPSENAVSVSVKWTNAGDLEFSGLRKNPSANVKCKIDGRDSDSPGLFKNRVIHAGGYVLFTCERQEVEQLVLGEKVKCLPETLISIDVSQYPVTIPMYKRCDKDYLISRANKVDKEVSELNTRVEKLQAAQEAIDPQFELLISKWYDMNSNGNPCISKDEMISSGKNIACYLSGIRGKFFGAGEFAVVEKKADGNWWFRGNSCQPGVLALASCITVKKQL